MHRSGSTAGHEPHLCNSMLQGVPHACLTSMPEPKQLCKAMVKNTAPPLLTPEAGMLSQAMNQPPIQPSCARMVSTLTCCKLA
jgi:hypothetical protein